MGFFAYKKNIILIGSKWIRLYPSVDPSGKWKHTLTITFIHTEINSFFYYSNIKIEIELL